MKMCPSWSGASTKDWRLNTFITSEISSKKIYFRIQCFLKWSIRMDKWLSWMSSQYSIWGSNYLASIGFTTMASKRTHPFALRKSVYNPARVFSSLKRFISLVLISWRNCVASGPERLTTFRLESLETQPRVIELSMLRIYGVLGSLMSSRILPFSFSCSHSGASFRSWLVQNFRRLKEFKNI